MRLLRIMKVLYIVLFLVGCGAGGNVMPNSDLFPDTATDENGNLILLDTPRMWAHFRETVDFRITNEKSGRRAEGGMDSWNDFWVRQIRSNSTGRENHEKYVRYIIERRRQEGLPELVYPEEGPLDLN